MREMTNRDCTEKRKHLRQRKPPTAAVIRRKLGPYCRQNGITKLELFGSTVRSETNQNSDIDLLATFQRNPGLAFFAMEEEMSGILDVSVHLLTRQSVETMSNPYRRESILSDARVIYRLRTVERRENDPLA